MAKNIFDEIYDSMNHVNNEKRNDAPTDDKDKSFYYDTEEDSSQLSLTGEEKEEKASKQILSFVIGIGGNTIALFCVISLYLCYSYDLCVFFDNYYLYIACVACVVMLYGIFSAAFAIHKKFSIIGVINIVLCLLAIIVYIIPFVLGLVYLQIGG